EVIALHPPQFQRPAAGDHAALAVGEPARRVVEERVAPRLRLQSDAEGRIGVDVDALDRVHLECDLESHASAPSRSAPRLMTEAAGGCNGASASDSEGVLDDRDAARAVHERDLEAHLAVLAAGFPGEKGTGRGRDPAHLPGGEAFGGDRVAVGRLHLDEDQPAARAQDEVDLAARAAPAPRRHLMAAPAVMLLDLRSEEHTSELQSRENL